MTAANILARQGHNLLQVGAGLLLLTSFWGFLFPSLPSPPLGLSAHKLASLLAPLFLGLGLVWPRLALGAWASRTAFCLLLYSSAAIVAAYVLGTVWGAGSETMGLAAGGAHGSALQETIIRVAAYSSGPTGIVSFGLILWGLRKRSGNLPSLA
jgi:(hydroxyamino)benzene mutase